MQQFEIELQMSEGNAENFKNELEDLILKYNSKGLIGEFTLSWNDDEVFGKQRRDTLTEKRPDLSPFEVIGLGLTEQEFTENFIEAYSRRPTKNEVREYLSH